MCACDVTRQQFSTRCSPFLNFSFLISLYLHADSWFRFCIYLFLFVRVWSRAVLHMRDCRTHMRHNSKQNPKVISRVLRQSHRSIQSRSQQQLLWTPLQITHDGFRRVYSGVYVHTCVCIRACVRECTHAHVRACTRACIM